MASQDNVETIKTDKTASEHDQDPNTATLQSGKSWVTSATEGEMAPQAWYYTWRAVSGGVNLLICKKYQDIV